MVSIAIVWKQAYCGGWLGYKIWIICYFVKGEIAVYHSDSKQVWIYFGAIAVSLVSCIS